MTDYYWTITSIHTSSLLGWTTTTGLESVKEVLDFSDSESSSRPGIEGVASPMISRFMGETSSSPVSMLSSRSATESKIPAQNKHKTLHCSGSE